MKDEKNIGMEQAILDAAEKLFLKKGFALTSTTEIAHAAGCNQTLVHYYYRTKEKLFEAIFDKKAETAFAAFLVPQDHTLSFEEKMTIRIEKHFEFLQKNPDIPFLIINEFITNPSRVNKLKDRIKPTLGALLNLLDAELKKEIDGGRIRPMTALDLLMTVMPMNIAPFIMRKMLFDIIGLSDQDFERMLEHRKKENVAVMMRSLKP